MPSKLPTGGSGTEPEVLIISSLPRVNPGPGGGTVGAPGGLAYARSRRARPGAAVGWEVAEAMPELDAGLQAKTVFEQLQRGRPGAGTPASNRSQGFPSTLR